MIGFRCGDYKLNISSMLDGKDFISVVGKIEKQENRLVKKPVPLLASLGGANRSLGTGVDQ